MADEINNSGLSSDELKNINKELLRNAELQARINENAGDYLKLIKDIKNLNKNLESSKKIQKEVDEKISEITNQIRQNEDAVLNAVGDQKEAIKKVLTEKKKELAIEEAKAKLIGENITKIKLETKYLTEQAKQASKSSAAFRMMSNDVGTIYNIVKKGYGQVKNYLGLFEMDKSMRMSALQMGILSKQTDSFRASIEGAFNQTADMGVKFEEVAQAQSAFSDALGRNQMLGKSGLINIMQIGKSTNMGAEAASQMAAEFQDVGYSAEDTGKYIEQTMNDAHKMGLNSSKVIKNIKQNFKLLNRYQFKDGVKGFAKMAETATKLGVKMDMVGAMADKLFNVEGAVEMSAQLQVMGGAWAQMADPMKLMWQARNDMDGLTNSIANAAAQSMHLAKDGSIQLSALEMQRLKKIAEDTGVSYDDIVTSGRKMFAIQKAQSQIPFHMSDDMKEYLGAIAKFDKNGKASIEVGSDKKLLSQLNEADIKQQMQETASMKERAKSAQTFDDQIKNLENQFKALLLPMLKGINEGLGPVLNKFSESLKDPKTIKAIGDFASGIGNFVGVVGKWIAENPWKSLFALGLFEAAKWTANGLALAGGFRLGTTGMFNKMSGEFGVNGGQIGPSLPSKTGSKFGGLKKFGKFAGGGLGGALVGGINALDSNGAGEAAGDIIGGIIGGAAGTLLDTFMGPFGTMLGAQAGSWIGGKIGSAFDKPKHDGYFGRPLHDGMAPSFGSDFSKKRAIIQGGKIHPIDNKDDLLAMKPNGIVDKQMNKNNSSSVPGTMNINFGPLRFEGNITLSTPGGDKIDSKLLNDPMFRREITIVIQNETQKLLNQGKTK